MKPAVRHQLDPSIRSTDTRDFESSLRAKIVGAFYASNVQEDDIFVSDGAKCDIGRLQLLFGAKANWRAVCVAATMWPTLQVIACLASSDSDDY